MHLKKYKYIIQDQNDKSIIVKALNSHSIFMLAPTAFFFNTRKIPDEFSSYLIFYRKIIQTARYFE